MDGYICNERSYRYLKRLEKILEDAKFLQQQSLKENLTTKKSVFVLKIIYIKMDFDCKIPSGE